MTDYLAILDSGMGCPTCGHSLAKPCGHCGESESHVQRRTQSEARRVLRAIFRVPVGADLDAALIEQGLLSRPAHRPRRDPTAARVNLVVRVHPETRARIIAEAQRTGLSQGQVIDRLAVTLPPAGA